jgi:hypothetical protein
MLNHFFILIDNWHLSLIEYVHLEFSLADFANNAFLNFILGIGDGWLSWIWPLLLSAVLARFKPTETASYIIT